MKAVAVDLDRALGETRRLWDAFLADAARRYRPIAALDVEALPRDRGAAAAELDRWAANGVGDWRSALARFAEDHGPLYVRPSARPNAALRRLAGAGVHVGVYTDAPEELARVVLAHLGVARHVEAVEAGRGARERLVARLGEDVVVVESAADLEAAAS